MLNAMTAGTRRVIRSRIALALAVVVTALAAVARFNLVPKRLAEGASSSAVLVGSPLPSAVAELLRHPSHEATSGAGSSRVCGIVVFFGSSCAHCLIAADSFGRSASATERQRTLWLTTPTQSVVRIRELLGPDVRVEQLDSADVLLGIRQVPVAFGVDRSTRVVATGSLAVVARRLAADASCAS